MKKDHSHRPPANGERHTSNFISCASVFRSFSHCFLRFEHVSMLKACVGEEEVDGRDSTIYGMEPQEGQESRGLIAFDGEITGEEEELVDTCA